jgi:mono/diheme cytochrome c family protein
MASNPILVASVLLLAAATSPASTGPEVLEQNCSGCHAQASPMGGLDMRTRESLLRGGRRGAALLPGESAKSLIFQAVQGSGELKMPPGKKLSAEAVEALRQWIDAGAPWQSQLPKTYKPDDVWAFQPLRKSPASSTVDNFIQQKLQEKGLAPAPPADKVTLIRRATVDLTGLPPTPEEVDAFVKDTSPAAFRTVVERLLASPHYGERWGRHWLDVVRYADSDGYSNDFERPNAWRYRDYVIRSFNRDKPYGQFILEQIAGDELNPGVPESLIATGFLRMGPWEQTGMSVAAVTRQLFLDDITHHSVTAFLGLTMGCAKCHDHKFDPLPTRDYYRLQAVFAGTEFAKAPLPFQPWENHAGFEEGRARIQEMISRTKAKLEAQNERIRQAELKKYGVKTIQELPQGVLAEALKKREDLPPEDLARASAYNKRLEIYNHALERFQPLAYAVTDAKSSAPDTFILVGGNLKSPGEKVTPGILSMPALNAESIPDTPAGRRLALARWIASESNPLTARVMVNRVWQHHFGEGLVGTPNNFGKMGKRPTHPELLDWLATYFIEHGWSVKEMHRVMMLSAAYQRSSKPTAPEALAKLDPENKMLSYFPPRRMEAEVLRDSMLAVSGELSPDTGGPGTFPEINEDLANQPRIIMGQAAPAYQPSPTRRERNRRTIYTSQKRSIVNPLVEQFNGPNMDESCDRREASIVPTQVFALFNSKFANDSALAFAVRVSKMAGTPGSQIDQAYRLAVGHVPAPEERTLLLKHYANMVERERKITPLETHRPVVKVRSLVHELTGQKFDLEEEAEPGHYEENIQPAQVSPETRAMAQVLLVLFNSNEFLYVF